MKLKARYAKDDHGPLWKAIDKVKSPLLWGQLRQMAWELSFSEARMLRALKEAKDASRETNGKKKVVTMPPLALKKAAPKSQGSAYLTDMLG
jgi:hypothetical protein